MENNVKITLSDILSYLNSLFHTELLDLCVNLINDNESAKNILLQKINDSEIERNLQPKKELSEISKTSTFVYT